MTSRVKGKRLLKSLKDLAGTPGPQLGLKVGAPAVAWLRPVGTHHERQSDQDVHCLTIWRNKFVTSFLNEFEATNAQTSKWLADIVGPDERRILFMIDDTDNQTVGYMGIGFINWRTGYAEADSIVRGRTAARGIMTAALRTLLSWGQSQLGLRAFGVRVRSDNQALAFYKKFGFVEHKRVPLTSRAESGKLVWYEDRDNARATISLVYHTLPR